MEILLPPLALALFIGSLWGSVVLALKWAKQPLTRFLLGATLLVVFLIASVGIFFAGCVALTGPVNFH